LCSGSMVFSISSVRASAFGTGGTIHRCSRAIALLLGSSRAASLGRYIAAAESLRAPRTGTPWTGDREHSFVSLVLKSKWVRIGDRRYSPLVHCFLCTSPVLLPDTYTTRLSIGGVMQLACFLFVLCRVSHYLLDHMHHHRITDENRM